MTYGFIVDFIMHVKDTKRAFRKTNVCRVASAKLRALRARNMLACQRALRAHVPPCLACLRALVLRCFACLRANVPCFLMCSRAYVLCVLRCLRANVTCVLKCSDVNALSSITLILFISNPNLLITFRLKKKEYRWEANYGDLLVCWELLRHQVLYLGV